MKGKRGVLVALLVVALLVMYVIPASEGTGSERVLTKIKLIHYRNGHVKPEHPGGGKTDSGLYTYLSRGMKWRTTEGFTLNPVNGQGLSNAFVTGAVSAAMAEWESHGGDIFGDLSISYSAAYDEDAIDNVNAISFGSYPQSNVIAVTIIWGYFGGPINQREIVETDVLFNTGFTWGDATVDSDYMDLQNIATHEIGHCAGMGDLYSTGAVLETMYGYSTEGETSKRDLYTGDIAGIAKLY